MTEEHPYLTVKQVAALLQLSPITIYRMVKHDEIPAARIGGQWRFSRAAIEAWLTPEPLSAESKQVLVHALPLQPNGAPWG